MEHVVPTSPRTELALQQPLANSERAALSSATAATVQTFVSIMSKAERREASLEIGTNTFLRLEGELLLRSLQVCINGPSYNFLYFS
jgi:hypothetical protein